MANGPLLQFYGGIGTIGGTQICIRDGEHALLLDLGQAYQTDHDLWDARLRPRKGAAGLRDLLAMGALPPIEALYAQRDAGPRPHLFISHLHLDHMALVDRVADDIPVWMHHDSLRLFRAVATVGEPPAVPVGARGFAWGQKIAVGPLVVTPLPVDHDISGAAALLIATRAGVVVYSGDLRLHGSHPELTQAFIRAANAAKPAILLLEGTRMSEEEPAPGRPAPLTEAAVGMRVRELLADCRGLALVALYLRNTERIGALAAAARKVGRTLALSPEAAHVYEAMGGSLGEVAIYRRARDRMASAAGSAPTWLSRLWRSDAPVVEAPDVRAHQQGYLLQLSYEDLPELIDLQPVPGSIFVHSNGEPLGRFDPAWAIFVRWLERFGLTLCMAGSTGHAAPADLQEIAASIAPRILMPIHSRAPERLAVAGIRRILPELGATYEIATGCRVVG